jgi:hypothetical protein
VFGCLSVEVLKAWEHPARDSNGKPTAVKDVCVGARTCSG